MNDVAAPVSGGCGGATALVAVHAGYPMASPDHGVELRVGAACDNIRRSSADEASCQAGASHSKIFSRLHCNLRKCMSHRAELESQLRLLPSLTSFFVFCLRTVTAHANTETKAIRLVVLRNKRDAVPEPTAVVDNRN